MRASERHASLPLGHESESISTARTINGIRSRNWIGAKKNHRFRVLCAAKCQRYFCTVRRARAPPPALVCYTDIERSSTRTRLRTNPAPTGSGAAFTTAMPPPVYLASPHTTGVLQANRPFACPKPLDPVPL
ncbi:hypothetical protein EVAR_945_1 [Eumeta japonica]|uniref:Uncharacterized protein n=1 Tax=Eumeta variegata TaxID=151549 RepID=A0A4C1SE50_EUMVA|nr:hypothetical protein EVAR_945_1 [Eumeta japonica]